MKDARGERGSKHADGMGYKSDASHTVEQVAWLKQKERAALPILMAIGQAASAQEAFEERAAKVLVSAMSTLNVDE